MWDIRHVNIVICVCACGVCVRVCICDRVLTLVFCGYVSVHAWVDRPMHIIDHEYMCICIKQTKQSPLSKLQ